MRRTTMISILSGLFASAMLVAMPVQADVAAGQKLHEAKCSSCHATPHTAEFYTSRVGKNYRTRDSHAHHGPGLRQPFQHRLV